MKTAEMDDVFQRFPVGPIWFSRTNSGNVASALESFFRDPAPNNYVCVSNVHITVTCRSDGRLREIQNRSFLTIADGQPVVFYGKLSGVRGIERVMGPDIMTAVFSTPAGAARRHFFLGGAPETLAAMEKNLIARFPGLHIAGTHSPPFRPLTPWEKESQRRLIQSAAPDYLWVCFGAPKQEYWMEENHGDFPHALLIGIGAAFAYHAGELRRAPPWAQKMGCEWMWRLIQEPGRLWKRYLRTNPVFMGMLLRLALKRLSSRGS